MTELSILESVIHTVLSGDRVQDEDVGTVVDIDRLAEDHAKATGKYRPPNYTTCTGCNRQYLNIKYLKYMLTNDIRKIDEQTALQLMGYAGEGQTEEFMDCCRDAAMANTDPVVTRVQNIDLKSLVIHYCMSRGIPLTYDLLMRLDVEDVAKYTDSYTAPSIDLDTAIRLEEWIDGTDSIDYLDVTIVYDDANDLEIDRHCIYLKECTSCGTANTYAYLYWMLTRLNVEPEEIFLDYRVYRPCCRATYMSPIMKPIEYKHERMIQNFTGLERRRGRERDDTVVVTIPGVVPTGRGTTRMIRTMDQMTAPKKSVTAPPKTGIKKAPTLVPKTGLKTGPKKAPPKLAPKSGPSGPRKAPAKLTVRR